MPLEFSAVNNEFQIAPPTPVIAMQIPMKKPALFLNQRFMSVGIASHRMEISPKPRSTPEM